jgi:hypothetical protein
MRKLPWFGALVLTGAITASSFGGFVSLPLPYIKGNGLGKFAVFNGAANNDTLLWRSAPDKNGNMFRVWGLDNGTWYGVTFGGKMDTNPGQLAAFCGFEAGRNSGAYDLATDRLVFNNLEPPPKVSRVGTFGTVNGKSYLVTKGDDMFVSKQGEYKAPNVLEEFKFTFQAGAGLGPAMVMDPYLGGPVATQPAAWNANKINLTQALTPAAMYAAFESGTHKWNPMRPVVTPFNAGNWEGIDLSAAGPPQPLPLAVVNGLADFAATVQPNAVPEPGTWLLMAIGCDCLLGIHWQRRKRAALQF